MLDSDLAELFETMKSRGYGLKEAYHEIGVRLHNKYFVESGFLDLEGEKPRIVVTISSQRDFIDCAVSHIGNYLVIRNIQEMVNLCLFLKFQCLKKIEDDKERLLAAKKSFNRSILDYQMDDQEPSTWLNEYHEPYSDDRFWLRRGEVDAAVVSPSIKTKNKRKKPRQGTP